MERYEERERGRVGTHIRSRREDEGMNGRWLKQ